MGKSAERVQLGIWGVGLREKGAWDLLSKAFGPSDEDVALAEKAKGTAGLGVYG